MPRFVQVEDILTVEEHLRLGAIYESKGELDNAISEYKKALVREKDNPKALFFLGNVYLSKNNLNEAERYYDRAISLEPSWGLVYNNLAWVYIKRGEGLTKAEEVLYKAVSLDPVNAYIYYDSLSAVYAEKGEYEKAEDVLLKALKETPSNDRKKVLMHLADLYRKMGLEGKAVEILR